MIIITKNILETSKLKNLPNIVLPEFLEKESSDFGYFVSESYILPYFVKHTSIFKSIRFILAPIAQNETCNSDSEKDFLNNVVQLVRQKKIADFIACPNPSALFSAVPDDSRYCSFGSYIINLQSSEEDIWASVHSKHKNVIRKAEKDGISISNSSVYVDECINLVKDTLTRQQMGVPTDEYFSFLKNQQGIEFVVALCDGKVQGSAILAWTERRSSYYLYGGSSLEVHNGSMSLLHWESIKLMKQRGVNHYDFVGARLKPKAGSKLEGIQRFKSRFGGEMKIGYLWKIQINPVKSFLYSFLLTTYLTLRKSNAKDIIDQENERF